MNTSRLEAFSDGVIAIIITIMVLELKAPESARLHELWTRWPVLVSYVISFIYVGIYWNNHHHLWQAAERVSGSVLWGNLHLLFWMSLIPFTTEWIGNTHFANWPMVFYGGVLLMSGIAYSILVRLLLHVHARDSMLARAIGQDRKGHLSLLLYAVGMACAVAWPWVAFAIYAVVAVIWIVPDPRIAREIETSDLR